MASQGNRVQYFSWQQLSIFVLNYGWNWATKYRIEMEMWIWISPKLGVQFGSVAKTSLEVDFSLFRSIVGPQMLPCEIHRRRQHMGSWGPVVLWFNIWLQRFNMYIFSCTTWTLNDWELIQASAAPVAAKIPLKSCYFTLFPIQLGYENAENVESFGQAMMQTQRSEPWKAVPWQRGWQSQALSLLRRVQCRKMFLECICESLSLALCLGAYINTATTKIPNKLKQNKTCIHGSIAIQKHRFLVKMKVSHKLHLWFPQDFSLLLCLGSLRPLWYLSKAFPFAHLILIRVYGNGKSLPPQGSNPEKESEYSMIV